MLINFYKYQGAGNDFVLLDNRTGRYNQLNDSVIKKLCDRHFGIGADGLMLLSISDKYDFSMKYFNSDGNESTMCGNGGRCIVRFANELNIIDKKTTFIAIDGIHEAELLENNNISLKMNDVNSIKLSEEGYILNTGSPHLVIFTENIEKINILDEARKIRYSEKYKKEGININFVHIDNNKIYSRTYERGVENETLACGTGAVAIALAYHHKNNTTGNRKYIINTLGGILNVRFENPDNQLFNNIYLIGPAKNVYRGKINI
jgi:diaminopimelate epimerase